MAVIYPWLKSYLPRPALVKGLIYALLVWLINAGIVLPALGQGFAGTGKLQSPALQGWGAEHFLAGPNL